MSRPNSCERRAFLAQAVLLLVGLGGTKGARAAHSTARAASGTVCGLDKRRHVNLCTVRLTDPLQFYSTQGVFKRGGNEVSASWLACLQMVFQYYGHPVPAANILRDAYGGNLPKAPWQDLSPLSHSLVDEKGRHLNVVTEKLSVRASDAAELLAENQPLIIGAFGHPVLLTAMSYTGDRLGGMTIVDATVLDPSPGKGTRVVSSPDWVNVTFISRVAVRKTTAKT
jgi:hypothetical protein